MKISAYKSPDGRLRTESYKRNDEQGFSIAEMTKSGTLITEFKSKGEVLNQIYSNRVDNEGALAEYMKEFAEIKIIAAQEYERIKVDAACSKCKTDTIERELDRFASGTINKIPVVPMFACRKCGTKFYSMSDSYLRHLVSRNVSLFEADEVTEKNKNENKFVTTLQEYIIRIFASKKIERLKVRG